MTRLTVNVDTDFPVCAAWPIDRNPHPPAPQPPDQGEPAWPSVAPTNTKGETETNKNMFSSPFKYISTTVGRLFSPSPAGKVSHNTKPTKLTTPHPHPHPGVLQWNGIWGLNAQRSTLNKQRTMHGLVTVFSIVLS